MREPLMSTPAIGHVESDSGSSDIGEFCVSISEILSEGESAGRILADDQTQSAGGIDTPWVYGS